MGKLTVIIEADSAEDLRQRVAETHAIMSPHSVNVATPAAKEVAKSGKGGAKVSAKKEEEAEAPPPAATEEAPAAEASEPDIFGGEAETPPPAKVYTLADVQAHLKKVVEGKGLPAAKAVLKKFGVAKASDTPSEKYPDFVAACEAALK